MIGRYIRELSHNQEISNVLYFIYLFSKELGGTGSKWETHAHVFSVLLRFSLCVLIRTCNALYILLHLYRIMNFTMYIAFGRFHKMINDSNLCFLKFRSHKKHLIKQMRVSWMLSRSSYKQIPTTYSWRQKEPSLFSNFGSIFFRKGAK